jgi:hypothetical protein
MGSSGFKRSHYSFKKRCQILGCKKKGKYIIDNKYVCSKHSR